MFAEKLCLTTLFVPPSLLVALLKAVKPVDVFARLTLSPNSLHLQLLAYSEHSYINS